MHSYSVANFFIMYIEYSQLALLVNDLPLFSCSLECNHIG